MPPSIGIVAYPGLIVAFGWAINDFHRSADAVSAIFAFLTMLLAMSLIDGVASGRLVGGGWHMGSLLWSYLGSRRFPREMSSFEVRRYFALSGDDRHVLRRRFRSRSRLGAALQLGFVRMTGATLDAFDYVPRAVLEHVGHQLEISAPQLTTLRALYRRQMTLFLHQQ
jgi:Domain of unknown function (DUF4158)